MAAVLGAGEDSALSHLSVARFWDVSRWRTPRISVVSTDAPQAATASKCTPCAASTRETCSSGTASASPPSRGCASTSPTSSTPYQLAYVIYRAEYWHIFNRKATEAAMERANGRHNLHVLERALELNASGSAGTRSAKEDAFRQAQAHEPLVNVKVDGIEVDFHWPDDERIVEVDGIHHHRARHEARRRAPRRALHRARVERDRIAV